MRPAIARSLCLVAAALALLAPAFYAAASLPVAAASGSTVSAPLPATTMAGQEHAEAGAEEEEGAEPTPWWEMPARWLNFVLLVALLWWMLVLPPPAIQDIFTFPGLKVILAERAAAVLAVRDLAERQRREAAELLRESEERLSTIESEVEGLLAMAREDAEREKQRAARDGKAQAEKIFEIARREVANERLVAQRGLRRFVADLAVNMAQQALATHLTADDQDRLIRNYLARLGDSVA